MWGAGALTVLLVGGAALAVVWSRIPGDDVDTIEDLQALRDALADVIGGAAHTRGMLNRLARR